MGLGSMGNGAREGWGGLGVMGPAGVASVLKL